MEVMSHVVHLFFFRSSLQPVPVPGGLRGAARQSSGWEVFLKEQVCLCWIIISVIIMSLTKIFPSKNTFLTQDPQFVRPRELAAVAASARDC